MSDYSEMDAEHLDDAVREQLPILENYCPSIWLTHADVCLRMFLSSECSEGRFWNCTQELVLEQLNGVQVYMRKATLFRGVAPDGVCYSVKRDNAARALTEVIMMALEGCKNGE